MNSDLLLVGSIPLDTPQEVFETFGPPLGQYLFAMPDGEVGPRRHWISRVHYQVLAAHPELEIVQRPAPDENGVERQFPRSAAESWWFKVKDGVKQVRFGDPGWRLGYARDALNSYFVFKTMKEKGVLPPHLRFQVSVPMVNSVLPPRIFPDQDDLAKIRPGYEAAIRAELETIIEKIPASELAIQWDCSTEVQDAYGSIPGYPVDRIDRAQSCRGAQPVAAHSGGRRARISFLFRHARRLAALPAGRSWQGCRTGQRLRRSIRPSGGLDSPSGARPQRRRLLRAAEESETAEARASISAWFTTWRGSSRGCRSPGSIWLTSASAPTVGLDACRFLNCRTCWPTILKPRKSCTLGKRTP